MWKYTTHNMFNIEECMPWHPGCVQREWSGDGDFSLTQKEAVRHCVDFYCQGRLRSAYVPSRLRIPSLQKCAFFRKEIQIRTQKYSRVPIGRTTKLDLAYDLPISRLRFITATREKLADNFVQASTDGEINTFRLIMIPLARQSDA